MEVEVVFGLFEVVGVFSFGEWWQLDEEVGGVKVELLFKLFLVKEWDYFQDLWVVLEKMQFYLLFIFYLNGVVGLLQFVEGVGFIYSVLFIMFLDLESSSFFSSVGIIGKVLFLLFFFIDW